MALLLLAAAKTKTPRHLSVTHKGSPQANPLGFEQQGRNHALPWQVRRAVLEFIRELLSSVSQSCWAWDVVGHIFEFSRTSGRLVSAEQDTWGFDRCLDCAESSCRHPWPWRAPCCRAISASTAVEVASKWPFLVGVCADIGGDVGGCCQPGLRGCVCTPWAELCPQTPSATQGLVGDEHPPPFSADGQ